MLGVAVAPAAAAVAGGEVGLAAGIAVGALVAAGGCVGGADVLAVQAVARTTTNAAIQRRHCDIGGFRRSCRLMVAGCRLLARTGPGNCRRQWPSRRLSRSPRIIADRFGRAKTAQPQLAHQPDPAAEPQG